MQYVPTHFGNDIALVVPISLNAKPYRLKVHNFNNRSNSFWGLDVGRSAIPIAKIYQLKCRLIPGFNLRSRTFLLQRVKWEAPWSWARNTGWVEVLPDMLLLPAKQKAG